MFLWSLSQEFSNHPCTCPLSWTYSKRESGGVWAEPTVVFSAGVVSKTGGVAGILVTARARESIVFPLCIEVWEVKPTNSCCLIEEQCPKEPVLLWLQVTVSPTFCCSPIPRSLSVLPEHCASVPTVLPTLPELNVYLWGRRSEAILEARLQPILPTELVCTLINKLYKFYHLFYLVSAFKIGTIWQRNKAKFINK